MIWNGTDHSINFYDRRDLSCRRYGDCMILDDKDVKPIYVLKKQSDLRPLNIKKQIFEEIEIENGILLRDNDFYTCSYDLISKKVNVEKDLLIVSAKYAQYMVKVAEPALVDILYVVDEPVKLVLENGYLKTVGCTGIKKAANYFGLNFYAYTCQNLYSKRMALQHYKRFQYTLAPEQMQVLNLLEMQVNSMTMQHGGYTYF